MNPKFEKIHDVVLSLIHELVFGGFGYDGSTPQTKMLKQWYKQYKSLITETIQEEYDRLNEELKG